MSNALKRIHENTNTTWAKCTHFRKKGIEDVQLNGCIPEEVTQQTGHVESSLFNAHCTHMNQSMLHASGGFNAQKEACIALRQNIDSNDEEHPLVKNTMLSKMDVTRRLIPKDDDFCE